MLCVFLFIYLFIHSFIFDVESPSLSQAGVNGVILANCNLYLLVSSDSYSVTLAGVQCCDFGFLQPLPQPLPSSWDYRRLPPCVANFFVFL